jgi:hypothetical protein
MNDQLSFKKAALAAIFYCLNTNCLVANHLSAIKKGRLNHLRRPANTYLLQLWILSNQFVGI